MRMKKKAKGLVSCVQESKILGYCNALINKSIHAVFRYLFMSMTLYFHDVLNFTVCELFRIKCLPLINL